MRQQDALLAALADLAEALAVLSARLGREAEQRLGQKPLVPVQRAILGRLAHRGEATVGDIAEALELSTAAVRAGLSELERRGLATRGPAAERSMHQSYRTTELADRLRQLTRDRADYHFGYALASMSHADLAALEHATEAIVGLAAAVGPPPPRHPGGRGAGPS